MSRLSLPRGARVTRTTEVRRVLDLGRSSASGDVVVYAYDRGDGAPARMALVVGARWGDAIRRNRIRRLLRESFRTARPELPAGFDLAFVPRGPLGARKMEQVRERLVRAAAAAAARFRAEGPGTPRAGRRP